MDGRSDRLPFLRTYPQPQAGRHRPGHHRAPLSTRNRVARARRTHLRIARGPTFARAQPKRIRRLDHGLGGLLTLSAEAPQRFIASSGIRLDQPACHLPACPGLGRRDIRTVCSPLQMSWLPGLPGSGRRLSFPRRFPSVRESSHEDFAGDSRKLLSQQMSRVVSTRRPFRTLDVAAHAAAPPGAFSGPW